MSEFFHSVGDAHTRLVDPYHSRQVDRSSNQDQVTRHAVDGLFQFMALHDAVAHSWQKIRQVGILLVGAANRPDREGLRIYQLLGSKLPRCYNSGTVRHFTVGEGRAVFDHQYTPPFHQFGSGHRNPASSFNDPGFGIAYVDVMPDGLYVLTRCGVPVSYTHLRAHET